MFSQPLPRVPKIFVPSVACPLCRHANDDDFNFCQSCGYERKRSRSSGSSPKRLRFDLDEECINNRLEDLHKSRCSSRYVRQKSSLEKEFVDFSSF